MINVGPFIFTLLTSDAAVFAAIGSENRVFHRRIGQGDPLPAITYRRVSGDHKRFSGGPTGLVEPTYEIASFATRGLAAEDLAELVRLAMLGVSVPTTIGGVLVRSIEMVADSDDEERQNIGSEEIVIAISHQYNIWADEAVP